MINDILNRNHSLNRLSINRKEIIQWIDEMYQWLFATEESLADEEAFSKAYINLYKRLDMILQQLPEQERVSAAFFSELNETHKILFLDLEAIYEFDPAAKSRDEIILSYPGFYAIAVYRLANILWQLNVPVIPRIISEYVHGKTGIDIHPGATIGHSFFIDHGTGIVIGQTAIIGNHVKIYQGVTLGALNVKKEEAETKRHPTIKDNVIIYANATILGGKTVIGTDTVVGGNVWISSSVPANSLVFNKSEIVIKSNKIFPEPLNFVI